MTLMPRDSGRMYFGEFIGNGMGVAKASLNIDGITYAGTAVRVSSNDTFGFMSAYGSNNRGVTSSSFGTYFAEGDRYVKAILSSSDGRGLRCDLVGRNHGGGGICVDDNNKVYDVILVRQ
jgi:hypothetical protein